MANKNETSWNQISGKSRNGNFFEDFRLGQVFRHGTPRTLTEGDAAVYMALTGSRYASHSSTVAAQALGLRGRPLDDFLVFNTAFGKTVPDISLNAVANLGYAEVRFLAPVFVGTTLRCESVVIGVKENSSRKSGVVYVRSTCYDDTDGAVLSWVRWVMVHKRNPHATITESHTPELATTVSLEKLELEGRLQTREALAQWCDSTMKDDLWEDYSIGERIDHPSGVTIEDADHMSAARLYQNNARPHFDALAMRSSHTGARLAYGGHVISVCRSLAYDGFENVLCVLAINGSSHVSPTIAGDTLYAYSEVLDKWKLPGRTDVGALRVRLVGLKNAAPSHVPRASSLEERGEPHPAMALELDYTVALPRRQKTHP